MKILRSIAALGVALGLAWPALAAPIAGPPLTYTSPGGTQVPAGVMQVIGLENGNGAPCLIGSDTTCELPGSGGGGGGGSAGSHQQTAALATAKVVCSGACNLYSFEVAADSTLSAAAWWLLIFDATSDPGNGAVTPAFCFPATSGQVALGGTFGTNGVAFTTGVTAVASTTGCFTETQSAHAFINGVKQ